MPTIKEQRVLFLAVAYLTQVELLVRNLPIGGPLSVASTVFIPSYVFITRLAFDKYALTVLFVVQPIAVVSVT